MKRKKEDCEVYHLNCWVYSRCPQEINDISVRSLYTRIVPARAIYRLKSACLYLYVFHSTQISFYSSNKSHILPNTSPKMVIPFLGIPRDNKRNCGTVTHSLNPHSTQPDLNQQSRETTAPWRIYLRTHSWPKFSNPLPARSDLRESTWT